MNIKHETIENLRKWLMMYEPHSEVWLNNSPYTIKMIQKELERRRET